MKEPLSCDISKKSCCSSSDEPIENDFTSHWDKAYRKTEVNKLGWYEETPEPSLELIRACSLDPKAHLLNVGAGATTLVDELQKMGYQNVTANDISPLALDKLKARLGSNQSKINWVVDDLTSPTKLEKLDSVDLWHDRAVLHFFNRQEEQDTYFQLLKKLVKRGGYAIIATFNLNGAKMCSGLPVYRYNEQMLADKLGSDFSLVKSFDYSYTMPSGGTRDYVYTLFKRTF
jgi:SAM-dependent methyltransferase